MLLRFVGLFALILPSISAFAQDQELVEIATLRADGYSRFGERIALYGDWLAAGSPGLASQMQPGQVHLFRLTTSMGTDPVHIVPAPDSTDGLYEGSADGQLSSFGDDVGLGPGQLLIRGGQVVRNSGSRGRGAIFRVSMRRNESGDTTFTPVERWNAVEGAPDETLSLSGLPGFGSFSMNSNRIGVHGATLAGEHIRVYGTDGSPTLYECGAPFALSSNNLFCRLSERIRYSLLTGSPTLMAAGVSYVADIRAENEHVAIVSSAPDGQVLHLFQGAQEISRVVISGLLRARVASDWLMTERSQAARQNRYEVRPWGVSAETIAAQLDARATQFEISKGDSSRIWVVVTPEDTGTVVVYQMVPRGASRSTGDRCSRPGDCSDGFCVSNVCCASECSDTSCMGCSTTTTGYPEGMCAPLLTRPALCEGTDGGMGEDAGASDSGTLDSSVDAMTSDATMDGAADAEVSVGTAREPLSCTCESRPIDHMPSALLLLALAHLALRRRVSSGSRRRWIALVTLPLLMFAGGAHAQDVQVAEREARARFELGRAHYEAGRFEEAASEFEQAYELTHRSGLLYNIHLAHRDAGNLAQAVDSLERYLASDATIEAEQRSALEGRLQGMRRSLERQMTQRSQVEVVPEVAEVQPTLAPTMIEPAASAAPERSGGISGAAIGTMVAGGVLVVGSVVTGVLALSARAARDEACVAGPSGDLCLPSYDQQSDVDRFTLMRGLSWGFGVAGGVALVSGVVLAFVLPKGDSSVRPDVACGLSGCSVGVTGRF